MNFCLYVNDNICVLKSIRSKLNSYLKFISIHLILLIRINFFLHIYDTFPGCGIDTHITIRNFRGDEPEIEEFVEHWRLLIADYLISKRYAKQKKPSIFDFFEIERIILEIEN
jgi:hypothetical protein